MEVSLNSTKLAEHLADESVSFKTQNKTKVEFGIDYTKEDVRESDEWKALFKKFHRIILLNRDL